MKNLFLLLLTTISFSSFGQNLIYVNLNWTYDTTSLVVGHIDSIDVDNDGQLDLTISTGPSIIEFMSKDHDENYENNGVFVRDSSDNSP